VSDIEKWMAADILTLGMAADEARRASSPDGTVTYRRVHVATPAAIAAGETVPDAASESRVYELPAALDEAVACVVALRRLSGDRPVCAYSMADIEDRAAAGWGALTDVLGALVGAGLTDVAEMPADRLGDIPRSMRALAAAGGSPRRITISHPINDRIQVLAAVCNCLDTLDQPVFFSPLPRHAPPDKPTTGYDDLRMVALARLMLAARPDTLVRIAIDWMLSGPKLAQVALTFGADHLDAVAPTSEPALGRRRETVADVERNIRAAGFAPVEIRD
jgi:hypothetical protein